MADKDYRSFIGRVYAGPWEREVTTQGGVKTVVEYMSSGPGVNGDVEIKLSFWDAVPDYVQHGAILFVSGKFSTYPGKDKEGNEKITKTINVNFCEKLGQNSLARTQGAARPAPKKAPVQDDSDDLGF